MDRETGGTEALKAIVLILVGFIFGFAVHAFIADKGATDVTAPLPETAVDGDATPDTSAPPTNSTTTNESNGLENDVTSKPHNFEVADLTLSIDDQPAGPIVMVSKATLTAPTWLAVGDNEDGRLGNILGAHLYPEGTHRDVPIELQRRVGIEAGKSYFGVMFIDNGNGVFDLKEDTLLGNGDGQTMAIEFRAY